MKHHQSVAAAIAVACLALAACEEGEEPRAEAAAPAPAAVQPAGEQPGTAPGPGQEPVPGGAELTLNQTPEYGEFLADKLGRPLYLFTADSAGQSSCYDQCAQIWPPLLAPQGTPTAGSAHLQPPLIGTTQRRDGSAQVTYNGRPLYYYHKDAGAARPQGQDVHDSGGEWYLVTPQGEKVEQGGRS